MTGQLDLLATALESCWFAARHDGHDQCATTTDGPCSRYPTERWPHLTRPDWLTADSTWVVLDQLRHGAACAEDFWSWSHTGRAAARVKDLTDRFGYTILTRPCRRHEHRGNNVEYVLVALSGRVS